MIILETRGFLDSGVIGTLVRRVREEIECRGDSEPEITCAASLAHHRLLSSVNYMRLTNVDLTSVPAEHLASLVSSVTVRVDIKSVSSCGLVTILDSVNSNKLGIIDQNLDSEETRALVRAMESVVKRVELHRGVTLDIRAMMEYSGQGKCREVWCYDDTVAKYRDQLRTWVTSRNWTVTNDEESYFCSRRSDL